MNIIHPPSPYPFGLDISDFSLKLVQLNRRRHYLFLQTISRVEIPEGYIQNGEIKNKSGVLKLINKLTKETVFGKISSQEVVACLPETKTFVKLLEIPLDKKSTREVIENEIKKNIPYSLEEVSYDWQLFSKEKEYKKIVIGVAPKHIVNSYYQLLREAGFHPVALETEPIAITRSLFPPNSPHPSRGAGQEGTKIVIDIGTARSSFIAYSQGAILFTISLPISGKKVTETIAKKLKFDFHQAEVAKIICGLDKNLFEGIVAKTLEEMIKKLISKIKKCIDYLEINYPQYIDIKKIYLCGGGAKIKGLDKIMTEELNIRTDIGNVFLNIKVAPKIEKKYLHDEFSTPKKIAESYKIKQNFSIRFATAVGLALRGIYVDEL